MKKRDGMKHKGRKTCWCFIVHREPPRVDLLRCPPRGATPELIETSFRNGTGSWFFDVSTINIERQAR